MFLIDAMNDLKLLSADIGNAYLNVKCRKRVHVRYGPELFGPEYTGKLAVTVRALYSLEISGASWRQHLSSGINYLGFTNTKGDSDVYRRRASKTTGESYYECLIVYVDDIICVSDNPKHWMDTLQISYRLRDVGLPYKFLGSNKKQWRYTDDNGMIQSCWALGSETYVKEACKVAKEQMKLNNIQYPSSRRHGSNSLSQH